MSELKEKAERAKEKVYRKRFINKMVEHVGTTVLQEDGKAVGKRAERGEYFIARVNKVWGNVMDRFPAGEHNPYNDEKSKSPVPESLRIVKGLEAGDIDKMEALGIYEVSPEDFAVAEFVDSSKLELQQIVRKGLDSLRKEME